MKEKILAFPSGKQIPALSKEQKEPVSTQIEKQQTKILKIKRNNI